MDDPELVQPAAPLLELGTVAAANETWSSPGLRSSNGADARLRVLVQAEEVASADREHGVVEGAGLHVLVEDGSAAEQVGVPGGAAGQVADGDGDVGETGELGHGDLLGGVVCCGGWS